MRSLTDAVKTAMTAPNVRPFILAELQFVSGTLRLWTGLGDLTWSAVTWSGIGTILDISPVEETNDVRAAGLSLTVRGVPSDMVARALAEVKSGQLGQLYLGLFDNDGAVIASPKVMFRGRLDVTEIDDSDPESPVIRLQYENALVDLERPREWRLTDAHQKKLYPGDRGLEHVASLADAVLHWGR